MEKIKIGFTRVYTVCISRRMKNLHFDVQFSPLFIKNWFPQFREWYPGGGILFMKFNCLNCSGEIRDTLALLDIYHKTKSKGLESNPSQTESSKDKKSNKESSSVPKRRKHWLKKPDVTKSLIEETRRNEIIDWRNQTERNHWLKKPDWTKSLIKETRRNEIIDWRISNTNA